MRWVEEEKTDVLFPKSTEESSSKLAFIYQFLFKCGTACFYKLDENIFPF